MQSWNTVAQWQSALCPLRGRLFRGVLPLFYEIWQRSRDAQLLWSVSLSALFLSFNSPGYQAAWRLDVPKGLDELSVNPDAAPIKRPEIFRAFFAAVVDDFVGHLARSFSVASMATPHIFAKAIV